MWWEQPRVMRWLRMALVALSCLYLLLFLYTALRRMRYPFELEWIESGMLLSLRHIRQGHGLYGPPTMEFTPFLYGPLYLYVSAAISHLVGVGYAALRLVSTLATLGTLGVIYKLIERETADRFSALVGAGLYVALYGFAEAFFDIGRVDSLFTLALLAAIYATRYMNPLLAGFAWLLAFETKQTALAIGLLVLLLTAVRRPRRGLIGAAALVVFTATAVVVQNRLSGGWYGYYTFGSAHGYPMVLRQLLLFVSLDLLTPLGIAFGVLFAALVWTRPSLRGERTWFYAAVSFTIYSMVWFVASHLGAALNANEPAYAWTAVLFGIALSRLTAGLEGAAQRSAMLVLLMAAAIQFASLLYNPGRFLPPHAVLAEREQFVQQLRMIPGEVYLIDHNVDALLAGKQPHAEMEALGMVLTASDARARDFTRQYEQEIASGQIAAIVTDDRLADIKPLYRSHYPLAISAVGGVDERFLTSQPKWILLPCAALHNGLAAKLIGPNTLVNATGCQP